MTPADPESDEQIMARLQRGDDSALDALMNRWQGPLRGYLFRYTQNEAAASDLAQETFVKVYQNCHRYNHGSRFSTWLFTIATNLCRNHVRWQRRHPAEPLDEINFSASTAVLRDDNSPADALREQEKVSAVRRAIDSLPHDLRVATLLFEYEDLSHAEIAVVLDCSPKAVETRLYRARQQLRRALEAYLGNAT